MAASTVLKTFFWFQIILVGVLAVEMISADNKLNVTTSLEDFVAQLEQQYASVIASDEAKLAEFRAGYERQLQTIDYQRVYIETELAAAEQKFYTLQFLNDLSKHCIQKYRHLLQTTAALRSNFQSCISSARSYLNSILSYCDSNVRSLTSLLNSNFKSGITNCKRVHNTSLTNNTLCVLNLNNGISVSFNTQQRTFLTNLDTARCSADTRIRQVVECVFRRVNETLSSIGSTSTLVDNCISSLESCTPCQNQIGTDGNNDTAIIVPESECPNVIDINTSVDTRAATIPNPFINLNSTLDCILVNFLRPQ